MDGNVIQSNKIASQPNYSTVSDYHYLGDALAPRPLLRGVTSRATSFLTHTRWRAVGIAKECHLLS